MSRSRASGRTVLLAGVTGLVGGECLRLLLDDPGVARVTALARRPLPGVPPSPKLETHVTGFDRLGDVPPFSADQAVCALGTTIKKAGSKEAFRGVDLEAVAAFAQLALDRGARHLALVSALGADPGSAVFYNRVKGEAEARLRAMAFRSVTIVRPSLLLGERAERRLGEEVGKLLGFLAPPAYRPVEARDVARSIVRALAEDAPGVRVVENAEIRRGAG